MKKFLSIMLFIATINYLYASEENKPFFLKEGDQFLVCRTTDQGDEECCVLHVKEFEKIDNLLEENEKKANELIKNIMNAIIRYNFFMLHFHNPSNHKWQKRSQKSTIEERKTIEEIIPRPNDCIVLPNVLSNYFHNGIDRSMLSAEEQIMYDKIEEIVKTLNENEK